MTELMTPTQQDPPLSRPIRLVAAACLGAGALLTALPQYAERLLAGNLDRSAQIAWGIEHLWYYRIEWACAMVGSFLLALGFLRVWQCARWTAPRLTAVGSVVLTWGMMGQILSEAATYAAQVSVAHVFGPAKGDGLVSQGYLHDPAFIATVLVPVVVGMFVGLILLCVTLWRAHFPRGLVIVLALWPLWDFFGPSSRVMGGEPFLAVAGVWLALVLGRGPEQRRLAPSS
jgi:hypothetical protein